MSIRVSIDQLQERLPDLLTRAAESGEECIIQRDGKDYAVLVSARAWKRQRRVQMSAMDAPVEAQERLRREVGQWLDAMGPEYRLSIEQQARMEELLARKQVLSDTERAELEALLQEGEAIMLRRAGALDRIR
jgi:antitoxin (DNA-binding transcriptional repressor) of toxin-antitoxin stability system